VHARRKIKEVHDRDGSPIAAEGLKRIAKFYKSEEAIRGQSAEQRNAARQEQTKPLKKDVVVRLEVQRSRISGQITSWQEAIRHCKIYGPLEAVSG
jgi:transposase